MFKTTPRHRLTAAAAAGGSSSDASASVTPTPTPTPTPLSNTDDDSSASEVDEALLLNQHFRHAAKIRFADDVVGSANSPGTVSVDWQCPWIPPDDITMCQNTIFGEF